MVVEVEHATLGPVKTLGLPVKFSDTPGAVLTGAPVYGQHTLEVLREHGFSAAEIEDLLAEGAIAVADAAQRMPTAGLDRLRRKTLERLRYETLDVQCLVPPAEVLAPLARLDLWLICRCDLTKPPPPCHARLPIEVKPFGRRAGAGGTPRRRRRELREVAPLLGAGRQRLLRREGRIRSGRARPARHRQPALRGLLHRLWRMMRSTSRAATRPKPGVAADPPGARVPAHAGGAAGRRQGRLHAGER